MKKVFPVLGFDIGGTKIAVCVADAHGRILASERLVGGTQQPYAKTLPQLITIGRRLVNKAGYDLKDIRACGISAPGPLDWTAGNMLKSPNMKWGTVPIRDDLAKAFDLPAFLDNDGNAGMLAEWFFGSAKGARNALYLTMSTGIGGGVIAEGQLLHGVNGNAAELGHVILDLNGPVCGCGMHGCLEAFCGGMNVSRQMRQRLQDQPQHALLQLPEVNGDPEKLGYPALQAGVKAGIPLAVEMWDEICLRLAQGIGLFLSTFNPEVIILGTVALYAGDLMLDPVRKHLPRFAWPQMLTPCRITLTALGTKIGELAGPAVALDNLRLEGEWQPDNPVKPES